MEGARKERCRRAVHEQLQNEVHPAALSRQLPQFNDGDIQEILDEYYPRLSLAGSTEFEETLHTVPNSLFTDEEDMCLVEVRRVTYAQGNRQEDEHYRRFDIVRNDWERLEDVAPNINEAVIVALLVGADKSRSLEEAKTLARAFCLGTGISCNVLIG